MSEYGKIETLYERDEKTHKLVQPLVLKNPVYGILKEWLWTEKIDGTNLRLIWSGGEVRIGGKTDNAQIPADLVNTLQRIATPEKFTAIFPDQDAVVYGEGYGAGIQRGGAYRPDKAMIVFDVLVAGSWWLNWENTCDVASKLGLEVVPFLGAMSLEEATDRVKVGFPSCIGTAQAEGMVGRPVECLFDKKGHRLITKLKTKDF